MSWLKTLTLRARENRKKATLAEDRLWQNLRRKTLNGLKFYRQCPIGYAIVDFYCPSCKLVIEIDGGIHENPEQQAYDEEREHKLRSMNLTVLRFTNNQVLHNLHAVLQIIHDTCQKINDHR